jgi:hypothetical protein
MDAKRYAKVRRWEGCISQCQSLKLGPNQIIRPILLGEMVKNNQKIGFMLFLAILASPNGPKKILRGLQVGGMYGPMSGLEKRPLTKLLDKFF